MRHLVTFVLLTLANAALAADYPCWRGPDGSGMEETSLAPDSMATLVGDLLYVENDSHHQSNTTRTIIDLKTNKVLAQYKAPFVTAGGYGGTVVNQPIIDGRLYLRCIDGHIRCYDVTTP